mmetsp:Transcript_9533/g.14289  ORF Transcript_9533/g.14289 Transcript_9533/m.14289 type:complete len:220 (-) Transcript_9533:332-991(-)|eukprot:CAMPEP_0194119902 /NCGR_PEP_ID=MMETSP0150-20130528/41151_1 /TAXON_ID=122233 /ORGANISM="Chaetoceros debilis, Strain MM31A-1" /LENGTH=219 /DNA_ID=CAMNT_0038811761 /DNA_START=105 /DNA_END=764 /DNA_ORIENTATION=+
MSARRHEKNCSNEMPDGDSTVRKSDPRDESSLGDDLTSTIHEIALNPKGKKLLNEYLAGAISDLNEIQRIQIMFILSLQKALDTDSDNDLSLLDGSVRSISSGTTLPSVMSDIAFSNSAVSQSLESFFSARSSSSSSRPCRDSMDCLSRLPTESSSALSTLSGSVGFIDRYTALTDLFYQFSEQSSLDDSSSFSSITTDYKKHSKRKPRKRESTAVMRK